MKGKKKILVSIIAAQASILGGVVSNAALAQSESQEKGVTANLMEEVVVVGIAGSLAKSLDTKRDSAQILEAISSEDLGKMPDQNIAESLQRVTGIQIDRSGGEGSVVRIRGLSQNLNTINGEKLVSGLGQTSQNGSFEDLPSELFKQVVVYKSQSANLVEGGIGGVIDLRTRRPFDFDKGELQFAGSLKAAKGDESGSTTPIGSLIVSQNWGDFGALLSLSYAERDHLSDSTKFERGFRTSSVDSTGDGVKNLDYKRARMISAKSSNQERERFGLNAAFQWRPKDDLELTAEYFGTFLDIDTETASAQFWADRGLGLDTSEPFQLSSGGYVENGAIEQNFYQANSGVVGRESEAHNFALSADWDNGGNLTASGQFTWATSELDSESGFADVMGSQGNNINFSDGSSGRVNPNGVETFAYQLNMPLGSEIPSITSAGGALLDPSRYWHKSQWAEAQETDSDLVALKADFVYNFDGDSLKAISFGARFSNREVTREDFRYLNEFGGFQYRFKDAQIQDPNLGFTLLPVVTNADDPSRLVAYDDFFSTSPGRFPDSILIESFAGMDNPVQWLNSLYPDAPLTKALMPITSFGVEEDTYAAYVMADFEGELGNMPYSLNAGVRFVQTDLTVTSNDVPDILEDGSANNNSFRGFNGTPVVWDELDTDSSYTDVLGSINATLFIQEDLLLKASINKAMARPNLGDLGRGFKISYTGNFEDGGPDGEFQRFASGSAGNPELDPDRATSFDLSLEHYFGEGSALIAAIFYKDIESFSINEISQEPIADTDGVVRDGGLVGRVVNGKGGFVKGFEIGAQHTFENGFGFLTNYTYSDSENEDFLDPTTESPLQIPGVSDKSYNVVAFYERYGIKSRVAYNWRSERLAGIFSGFPRYTRDFGQLDASIGYEFTERLSVSLDGINLTGNDTSDFLDVGDGDHFYNWQTDETRYILSMSFKL